MDSLSYHDFRGFIEEAKKISEWRLIEGADWDNEIGALIESTAELDSRPMLLFDKIKGYPAGFRLVSLAFANYKRTALAFGISPDKSKLEVVRLLARKMKSGKAISPEVIKSAPLMENVMEGDAVDLFKFPAPRFHDGDGGRYIGTGDCLINAEPESGFINAGHLSDAAPRSRPSGPVDESGAAWTNDLCEVLGTGEKLSGRRDLQPRSVIVYARAYQSRLGQFRARLCRRPHGTALTDYSRSVDRSADSRGGGDRHRGRGAAAKSAVAARGAVR